jgi:ubiquinone/menaquinone biosynthesis C-methylase UbiE
MVRMDITDIQYPDEYFDVIYCSHVMEHVQDDKKAMREFYRVLKSGGWAILLVPITADKTSENSSVVDPSERLRIFGQEDHVRRYGTDYLDRLEGAGFEVKINCVSDLFEMNDIERMGITAPRCR